MKIGLMDSGTGGLSVLHVAKKILPNEHYLYYADLDHCPYGKKTNEEILSYVDDAITFLKNKGCEVIVIACNTATSVAVKDMREKYKDLRILGMEPAVKKALSEEESKRILVLATPVTVKGDKLKDLLEKYDAHHQVDAVSLVKLPEYAEKLEFNSDEVHHYLKESLKNYDPCKYASIVFGCTHFNYFKDSFSSLYPHVSFIDGNVGTINNLKNYVDDEEAYKVDYYISGREASKEEIHKMNLLLHRLEELD